MELVPFPSFDFWTCGSWLLEKLYHRLDTDSEHILRSGEPFPCPPGYWHLIGTVTVSLKGHSIFLSKQLLQDGGEHGKTSGLHDHRPTLTLLCVSSEFLDHKQCCVEYYDCGLAFCKSMDGHFGRHIMCREG